MRYRSPGTMLVVVADDGGSGWEVRSIGKSRAALRQMAGLTLDLDQRRPRLGRTIRIAIGGAAIMGNVLCRVSSATTAADPRELTRDAR